LASWVFKALVKGLSKSEIKGGCCTTSFFSFYPLAIDKKMDASKYHKEMRMYKAIDWGTTKNIPTKTFDSVHNSDLHITHY